MLNKTKKKYTDNGKPHSLTDNPLNSKTDHFTS